jgi:hypothetical protein
MFIRLSLRTYFLSKLQFLFQLSSDIESAHRDKKDLELISIDGSPDDDENGSGKKDRGRPRTKGGIENKDKKEKKQMRYDNIEIHKERQKGLKRQVKKKER